MEHHQYDRAVWMLKAGIELSYQQLMPFIEVTCCRLYPDVMKKMVCW